MNKRFILFLLSFSTVYSADNPTGGGGSWGFLKPYIISAAKTAGTIVLTSMVPSEYKPPFARHKKQSASPATVETPSVEMTNREPVIGGDHAQDQFLKPGEYYDEKTGEIYRKDGNPRQQPGTGSAPSNSVSYTGSAGGQNVSVGVQKGGILNALYAAGNYLFGPSAKEVARDREIEAYNKELNAKIPSNPQPSPGVIKDAHALLNKRLVAIPNYTDAELDRRQRLAESNREADLENPSGTSAVRVDILNKELTAIQQEKVRRQTKTTVTQATAMLLTSQTVGAASTEKTTTVGTEEQRLSESIRTREAQIYKWRNSPWPSDWFITGWHVENYEKETNAEKQKLAEMQGPLTQLKQYESEKQEEISKKIIDHRNNCGGGDKEPEKDPKKGPTLTDAAGIYGAKKVKEAVTGHSEPHPTPHTESHSSTSSASPDHPTHTKHDKAIAEHKPHDAKQFDVNEKAMKEARKSERAQMNHDNQPFHEKGIEPHFPQDPGQRAHQIEDRTGHFKEFTPAVEEAVRGTINKEHFDYVSNGNSRYTREIKGIQVWVEVRPDGTIKNFGGNDVFHTKNPTTGRYERPAGLKKDGPGVSLSIGAAAFGALADESAQASNTELFLSQATIDKIKGDHMNPMVDNRIKNDPNPFQLPPAPESHKPSLFTLPAAPADAKPFTFTTTPEMKAIIDRRIDNLQSMNPPDQIKEIMKPISTPSISIPGSSTSTKTPTFTLPSSTGLSSKSGQSTPSALSLPKTSTPSPSLLSIPTKSGSSSSAPKMSSASASRSSGSSTSYRPSTPSSGFGSGKGGGYSGRFGSKRN